MGIGMATLIPINGNAAIEVSNINGVRIASILLQAGFVHSNSLLVFGKEGFKGDSSNPSSISDVFARVGGMNAKGNVSTKHMVTINSGNIIIDNVWLWRADHDILNREVSHSRNPVANSLVVNGDDVIAYGVACEHALENLLIWNGENGKNYFYQSELP